MHGDRELRLTSALRSFEVATNRVSNTARHANRSYLEHNALPDRFVQMGEKTRDSVACTSGTEVSVALLDELANPPLAMLDGADRSFIERT